MPCCLVVSGSVVLRFDHGIRVPLDGNRHTGGAFGYVCPVWCGSFGGTARNGCHSKVLEPQFLDEDENNDGHPVPLWIQSIWRYRHFCEWVEDGPVYEIRTYDSDYSEFYCIAPDPHADWQNVSYRIPWITWSVSKSKSLLQTLYMIPLFNSPINIIVCSHGRDLSRPGSCCLLYAHRQYSWHSSRFDMLERWPSSILVSNFSYCRHSVLTILDIADSLIY